MGHFRQIYASSLHFYANISTAEAQLCMHTSSYNTSNRSSAANHVLLTSDPVGAIEYNNCNFSSSNKFPFPPRITSPLSDFPSS